jgi:uncharacterized NAD-dependent epimerase/dehydratase family protein
MTIKLQTPYLLFTGNADERISAKTAVAIAEFRPEFCMGYNKMAGSKLVLTNLPELTIKEAATKGAKTFIIGLANSGGFIADEWLPAILTAISCGLDIASGLHVRLEHVAIIKEAAEKFKVKLHDVRFSTENFTTATGLKRGGKRILTVGTDCSSGKMYTALMVERALNQQGKKAHFVATGQTGILLNSSGIAVDAVIADFIAGAVEYMTPALADDQYYVIEGQGSLYHPSFAGVSLGLLHGAAPDYLILCHDAARKHMRHLPDYKLPDLGACMKLNEQLGSLTNRNIKTIAISCNTSNMQEGAALDYLAKIESEFNLPAGDPFRFSADKLLKLI